MQDSWAADAGILAGSELLELNGQEVPLTRRSQGMPGAGLVGGRMHAPCLRGRMSADDFRAALKQRPLRVKLAPPMAEAWHLGKEM